MKSENLLFWSLSADRVLQELHSSVNGLSDRDAKQRLIEYGANSLKQQRKSSAIGLLINQFKSPIVLILMFAAGLSIFLNDRTDAIPILAIVLISGLLGFWQERGATDAVEKLLALVQVKATVLRQGETLEIPHEDVVPGEIVLLAAGDSIPGDCLVLESKDLSVNEAALTGETYPADKMSGVLPETAGLSERTNTLYMGTHVISGSAQAVVVRTGKQTEFGKVSERLKLRPPETEFERGLSKFGYFLYGSNTDFSIPDFCCQCLSQTSRSRIISVLFGSSCRFDPATLTSDRQCQSGAGSQADGKETGNRQAAGGDREFRQHERVLYR